MRILSIGKQIEHPAHTVINITEAQLSKQPNVNDFDYLLISGGDGTLRRVIQTLGDTSHIPPIILNPTGSFNVIAKLHKIPPYTQLLDALSQYESLQTATQPVYALNEERFLFSAGNMGDLQHIFMAESLRFGILKKGMFKYLLALLFLLPAHLIMTPLMLMSKARFFIFTPLSVIRRIGSFYGVIDHSVYIDLGSEYNHLELDGDIVTLKASALHIRPFGEVAIALKPVDASLHNKMR